MVGISVANFYILTWMIQSVTRKIIYRFHNLKYLQIHFTPLK